MEASDYNTQNVLYGRLFNLYTAIGFDHSKICKDCSNIYYGNPKNNLPTAEEFSKPLSIWFVGPNFSNDKYKVMFVGKDARGVPGEPNKDGIIDCRERGIEFFTLGKVSGKYSAYWANTRDIIMGIYNVSNTDAWKYTAFSNMLKCNSGDKDNLPESIKDNCIIHNQVIWKEIEILKPKNVIFYTHTYYDKYIDCYRKSVLDTGTVSFIEDNTAKDFQIAIGNRQMPWWSMVFSDKESKPIMRLLRIGHPQCKKKDAFIREVSNWITSSIL
jgi:hypothetical protein